MSRGGAIFHPPPRPRAGAGAGADQTAPRSSRGARLHPPPRGGRRGVDQTLPGLRGGASLHPPLKVEEEVIHNRLSGTRGQKKGRQKRGASLHFFPPLRAGSVIIQVQTPLVPVIPRMIPLQLPNPLNLPNLIIYMSDVKPFSMMTLTKNLSAHIAWSLIRLVILIQKIHRFLFSFANIDFAENVSRVWRGCRIVP